MASNNYSNELRAIEKLKKKRDFIGMCEKLIHVMADLKRDTENSYQKVYEKLDSHVQFCLSNDLDVELKRCLYSYMATLHRIYKNKDKCLEYWRNYWLNTAITRELDEDEIFCDMLDDFTLDLYRIEEHEEILVILNEVQAKIETQNFPRKKEYAQILHHKGKSLRFLERNDEALTELKRCLKIMKKFYNPNDFEITIVCENIGMAQSGIGQHDQALKTFQNLFDTRTKNYKTDSNQLAMRLSLHWHIGQEHFYLKNYEKAVEILRHPYFDSTFKEALKIHAETTTRIQNCIDECYKAMNKTNPEARIFLDEKLKPKLLESERLLAKGDKFMEDGKFQRAIQHFQKGTNMRIELLDGKPDSSMKLLQFYSDMGICHEKLEKYNEAIEFYQKALTEFKNCDGYSPGLQNIADIYVSISQCYFNIRYYEECVDYAREGKQISLDDKDMICNLYNIGQAYFKMSQFGQAFMKFQQVKNLCLKLPEVNEEFMQYRINAFWQMAWCKFAKREYEASLKLLKDCLKQSNASLDFNYKVQVKYKIITLEAFCLRKLERIRETLQLSEKTMIKLEEDPNAGSATGEIVHLLFNAVLCSRGPSINMLLGLDDPRNDPVVPYEIVPHDEDVHAFLNTVKVTKFPFKNKNQAHGYARYRSSVHICQFLREKSGNRAL